MSFQGSSTLIIPPLKSQNLGRLLTHWVPHTTSPLSTLPSAICQPCQSQVSMWYLSAGGVMIKGWGGTHRDSGWWGGGRASTALLRNHK